MSDWYSGIPTQMGFSHRKQLNEEPQETQLPPVVVVVEGFSRKDNQS